MDKVWWGEATVTNYYGEGEVDLFDSSQQMVKYTETGIITLLSHPSSSVRLYRWSMWQNYAYQKILMYSLKQARNILGKSEDKNN